jgi:hypothetical protein
MGQQPEPNTWTVGYDVGQVRDPSALVIAEAVPTPTGRGLHTSWCGSGLSVPVGGGFCDGGCEPERIDVFRVHDLGRLPLGTRYPAQVRSVRDAVAGLNARGHVPFLLVDVTGVGRPVVDALREGLEGADCTLSAVTLTGGMNLRPTNLGAPEASVGKEYLVSRMQVLLDQERVLLPDDKESRALVRELQDFELRASASGLASGAFRTGAHDDLAIALGLACLFDPSGQSVRYWPAPWT